MKKANLLVIGDKKARQVRDECPFMGLNDAKHINNAAIHLQNRVAINITLLNLAKKLLSLSTN